MSENKQSQSMIKDKLLLTLSLVAVFSTIYLNATILSEIDGIIRASILIVLGIVAVLLFALTTKGKKLIEFSNEAKVELKKVIFPTRQETIQTALMVVVITVIVGLFLFLIDWLLVSIIL